MTPDVAATRGRARDKFGVRLNSLPNSLDATLSSESLPTETIVRAMNGSHARVGACTLTFQLVRSGRNIYCHSGLCRCGSYFCKGLFMRIFPSRNSGKLLRLNNRRQLGSQYAVAFQVQMLAAALGSMERDSAFGAGVSTLLLAFFMGCAGTGLPASMASSNGFSRNA